MIPTWPCSVVGLQAVLHKTPSKLVTSFAYPEASCLVVLLTYNQCMSCQKITQEYYLDNPDM